MRGLSHLPVKEGTVGGKGGRSRCRHQAVRGDTKPTHVLTLHRWKPWVHLFGMPVYSRFIYFHCRLLFSCIVFHFLYVFIIFIHLSLLVNDSHPSQQDTVTVQRIRVDTCTVRLSNTHPVVLTQRYLNTMKKENSYTLYSPARVNERPLHLSPRSSREPGSNSCTHTDR